MAAFYAVYHGPKGLKDIASNVHTKAVILYEGLKELGHEVKSRTHTQIANKQINN